PSERLVDKPLSSPDETLLHPSMTQSELRARLRGLHGIIFFERNNWHPQLLPTAHSMGIRTICVPNWEWFKGEDPLWRLCDLFICPTHFTMQILHSYGYHNAVCLPWALNLRSFKPRRITGPARFFVHN